MTLQVINNGSGPGDAGAETVYAAFAKAKANFAELYGLYGSEVEACTFTTKQDNLAVADYTRILRWNGAGSTGITGIAAPASHRVLTIVNASTDYLLWLENENTASSAANRIMLPDSFWAFLMPGDTITLWYDTGSSRWRVLSWPTRGINGGFSSYGQFADGSAGLFLVASGTGAASSSATVPIPPGERVGTHYTATGTNTTGYANLGASGNAQLPILTGQDIRPALHLSKISKAQGATGTAPDATDNYRIVSGFYTNSASTAYGYWWQYYFDGASAVMAHVVADNSVETVSVTGAPSPMTDTTPLWLGVFLNNGPTRADFLYCTTAEPTSLVLAASRTDVFTRTSSSRVTPGVSIRKSAGVNNRACLPHRFGFRAQ